MRLLVLFVDASAKERTFAVDFLTELDRSLILKTSDTLETASSNPHIFHAVVFGSRAHASTNTAVGSVCCMELFERLNQTPVETIREFFNMVRAHYMSGQRVVRA